MNGEYACWTSEASHGARQEARRSGSFHSDLQRLSSPSNPPASETRERDLGYEPLARCDSFQSMPPYSEPPPSSGRSEAVTHPYEGTSETPPPSSFTGAARDWCVDVGHEMLAMSTFELWEALERGQVLASMRVWREGLECWTPVGEISDFACAVAAASESPSEPPMACDDVPTELGPEGPTPPPESGFRPSAPAQDARWVALGSAVAVVALVMAICVRAAALPVASAPPGLPPTFPVVDRSAPESVVAEASHHDERGQRRLPRGGGRAYGR
jgi:hypothetical protein